MELCGGLEVHSSNTRVGVVEGDGRRVYEVRLANDPEEMLRELHPMKARAVFQAPKLGEPCCRI